MTKHVQVPPGRNVVVVGTQWGDEGKGKAVDYLADPTNGNKVILDAVNTFGKDFGWTYSEGTAAFGVETIKKDGLVANDPASGVLGQFDEARVQSLIDIAVPIYKAQGATPKDGVKPSDIVTNQFIDPSIKLP